MYFNSMDKRCKSEFGAVKTGKRISYYLDAYDFAEVYMQVRYGENGGYVNYQMKRQGDERYELTITFDKPGVYFYRFLLKNPNCEQILYRSENGMSTTVPPNDWQQTVYSSVYTTPEWMNGGLIYQIFPDRFYKADIAPQKVFEDRVNADWNDEPTYALGKTGRVINNDYFGGNLVGIIEKLPYIKSLGVTAIYLNPIFEAHSNHRYNTANYMKVDPMLGTNDDFRKLCAEADKMDIKIILDGVFSHTGSDSIYFNREGRYNSVGAYQSQQSEYSSWYKFVEWPDKYTSWWGFESLPETDENDENFSEFITGENGVIDYWMSMGAAGFRLDVADELPDEFIKKIRIAIKRNRADGILYGEVWEDASNKISYGVQRAFLYGKELDSVMNYPFAELTFNFLTACGGVKFMNGIMQLLENYPKCSTSCLMNLLGTHDTERLITRLAGEPTYGRDRQWQHDNHLSEQQMNLGKKLVKLASVLQYTLPGVPSLYYGDEILTEGYRDPFNRSSFKWEKTDNNSLLEWYRALGKIRAACPAMKTGKFIPAQYENNYVSYIRACDDGEICVIVNPSDVPADIWLLPGWSDDKMLIGDNEPSNGILTVAGKTAAVLGRGKWAENFIKIPFSTLSM